MRRSREKQVRKWAGAGTRARILSEFRQSGLSAIAFAAKAGMSVFTLRGWRRRERKAGREVPAAVLPFVEAVPRITAAEPVHAPLAAAVVLPSGTRVEFFGASPARLEAAVAAILERC